MKKTFVLLMMGLLLLVGCNTQNVEEIVETTETETTAEEIIEEPVEKVVTQAFGEELRLAIRNPETLNPLLNEEQTVDKVLRLCFESLFVLDEEGVPQSELVESYEFSSDYSYITINLANDILFHDGTLLTASDVEYSFEVLSEATPNAIYKSTIENIQRMSVIDENNIRIYFKQAYAFALYDLTFPIIKKDFYLDNEAAAFSPMGTGPYRFEAFTNMKELKFTYFDDYRSDYWIKDINCTITRDEEVEDTAFKQHLIDIVHPTKINWQTYYEDETNHLYEYTSNYYEMLGFNFNNSLLIDKNVRHAFAYAIDRETILRDIYLNHATITDTIINANSWLMSNEGLQYSYDLEKAKEKLASSGYEDSDENGIIEFSSETEQMDITFNLLVNEGNPIRVKIAEMIKENMMDVGININIVLADKDSFVERLVMGDYDLVLTAIELTNKPDFTDLFHSESVINGNNFINYKNEFMNAVLEATYRSETNEALANNITQFNELFVDELPYFSMFFLNSAIITNDDVYGDITITADSNDLNLEEWYISR